MTHPGIRYKRLCPKPTQRGHPQVTWPWLAVAAYRIAIGVFAWDMRGRYPDWPLIPTAIMAVFWPYFVTVRLIALWKTGRGA